MIGIEFLSHLLAEKMFEKNVWFFFPDFREVILKVFPGSKRAEIATIRFVTPELSRKYFLGAKKSSKFIEFWHFQNGSFLSISLTKNLKKKFFSPKFFLKNTSWMAKYAMFLKPFSRLYLIPTRRTSKFSISASWGIF